MKIRVFIQIVAILFLATPFGCSRHQTFRVDDEKKRWTSEGWNYLETFGNASDDTVMVANSSSATARDIAAFARVDGVATNKTYEQTDKLYLVVSMQRQSGDAFALIFTKQKP
jgi:hypothetical protein